MTPRPLIHYMMQLVQRLAWPHIDEPHELLMCQMQTTAVSE